MLIDPKLNSEQMLNDSLSNQYLMNFFKTHGIDPASQIPSLTIIEGLNCFIDLFNPISMLNDYSALGRNWESCPHLSNDCGFILSYGITDNIQSILDTYEYFLSDRCPRKFVVSLEKVTKESQPERSGFRFHKWGKYIGNIKPTTEYLYDSELEFVYVFELIELVE